MTAITSNVSVNSWTQDIKTAWRDMHKVGKLPKMRRIEIDVDARNVTIIARDEFFFRLHRTGKVSLAHAYISSRDPKTKKRVWDYVELGEFDCLPDAIEQIVTIESQEILS
jgi:hypothetical protein